LKIIGQRFVLKPEEGEGLPDLMRNLPRSGAITEQRESTDGNKDWYVLEFDEPFDYQKEFEDPKRWKLIAVSKVLVRSRWQGYPIGGQDAATFILVPPDEATHGQEKIDVKAFYFDGRGMIERERKTDNQLDRTADPRRVRRPVSRNVARQKDD
jgi:hypothetical protein